MNKIKHNISKKKRYRKLLSPLIWSVLTAISLTAFADSSGSRPGYLSELPDIDIFRPYANPVCADHMQRSTVEVINDANGGTHWYFYTCTFRNDGFCSLEHDTCPEQVCHPYTDWISPWDNHQGQIWQPNLGEFYICISIGTPYPF